MPLIRAVAGEIRERCMQVLLLQTLLDSPLIKTDPGRCRQVVANIASNRRELRHAREEMEHLGFSVLTMDPLRVCVQEARKEGEEGAVFELVGFQAAQELKSSLAPQG